MSEDRTTVAVKSLKEDHSSMKLLWELFFNLCLPTLLLIKGHIWLHVSPKIALALAIGCPLTYGMLDWFRQSHFNWIALLGFISVVFKGCIGLFEGSNQLLAINEMLLPLLMGCALMVLRLLKKPPLLPKLFLNEQFCHVKIIRDALERQGNQLRLQKRVERYEWCLSGLFFFSAILNYVLAKQIVVHPAGSSEFNHELGVLTGWSFVIIAMPATIGLLVIVWRFFCHVRQLTALSWEEILKE